MNRKKLSLIVASAILIVSLTGCDAFFSTKYATPKNTQDVEDITPTITEEPLKVETSIDDIGANVDKNTVDNKQQEFVFEDGTKMTVSTEALPYVENYIRMKKEEEAEDYPQEQDIKLDKEHEYETTVESSFKISKIDYKTLKYSDNAQATLQASIVGSIAGLDGVYQISIPYEKAVKLTVGDAFAITYQTVRLNDKVVITNIKY